MKLTNSCYILLFAAILLISRVYGQSTDAEISSKQNHFEDSVISYFHKLAWEKNPTAPNLAQNYLDSALTYIYQKESIARVLEIKAGLYFANANYKESSLNYWKSVYQYRQSVRLKFRSGYAQIQLGTIFYKLNEYTEALKHYKSAIPLFDSADSYHKGYGKALAYNNIGLCYTNLNDFHTALQAFQKGLEWRLPLQQDHLTAHSYGYLAKVYISLNQLDKADSVINAGLVLSNLEEDNLWRKKLEIKHALVKILQGKTDEGRLILEEVNKYAYQNKQQELYNELNHSLSHLEWEAGNYDSAQAYAERGYSEELIFKDYKKAIGFAQLSKAMALEQNDPKKALLYMGRISNVKDSLIALNSNVLAELLTINEQLAQEHLQLEALQDTTNAYSTIINDQKGLLIASIVLISLLLLITYMVIRLNAKLKKSQKYQRELNLRVLAVINRTESLIISLGPEGVIRVINKPAVNFFKKWVQVELKAGDNMEDKLQHTQALQSWKEVIKKSYTTTHWKEVSQLVMHDKKKYYLENFSAITHKDGTYAGLVVVSNDITKEHEYNIKMSEQNSTLEKSNKAKERMLSILAHDLKDAVYSAHSLSELVLETPEEFPKEELIHLFSLLHGNFDKTKSLLDGLLDWIRTQTGGLDMTPTPFNLRELGIEVFEACYPKSVSKRIALSMEIPSDFTVSGDREMIKTVLRNLVNNAIKYTQPETGSIKLVAKLEDEVLSIHVKDNGQGISEANQKKLFQGPGKFTTVGTANEQGTGFGLNLCKELINLHKRELCLISKEGYGSDFYFSLPLSDKKDLSKKQVH